MKRICFLAVFLMVAASPPAFSVTREELLIHFKESRDIPPDARLSMDPPQDSELKGFQTAVITIEWRGRLQRTRVYISEDGRHYFLGAVQDAATRPDAERWARVRLDNAAAKGGAKAAVTVVEYSDLQCPHCRTVYSEKIIPRLLSEYKDKVRVLFKHLPLTNIHPWAESAAVAAECVRRQGTEPFWAFHDALFENQPRIAAAYDAKPNEEEKKLYFRGEVLRLAAGARVGSAEKFSSCYDSRETLPLVRAHAAEAGAVGINSTPTFLVNGHPVGRDYGQIRTLVEEFLSGTHAKP